MRGRTWVVLSAVGLLGVMFLAVFPVRAYLAQRQQHRDLAAQVSALAAQNRELEERARRLRTDEHVELLARQHYNLGRPGEETYAFLPGLPDPPPAPAPAARPREHRNWLQSAWARITSLL